MDLANIQDAPTGEMQLLHPSSGAKLGDFFGLLGPESEPRTRWALAHQRELRAGLKRTGNIDLGDPAADKDKEVDYILECVTSWRHEEKGKPENTGAWIEFNGERLVFTKDNLYKLITSPKHAWIRKAILAELNQTANFIKDSSTTSAPGSSGVSA